ncbi:MAG TPA: hypothetical protein VK149_12080 [Sideroxyarcus sp.]|nr:hypothetical protein [Sideroxyarcus sp.]
MTLDEFKATGWLPRMAAIYKGKRYEIDSVDFEESLVGLEGAIGGCDDIKWVRCENVTLDGRWPA